MASSTLKEVARSNRKAPTPAAQRLWRFLRGRRLNGYKFAREVVIGCYIADFVNRCHKIIIEVDGGQHGEKAVIAYDNKRTEFLGEEGYQVVRIWNNEVFENISGVLENILLKLQCAEHRHPRLEPHEREKED